MKNKTQLIESLLKEVDEEQRKKTVLQSVNNILKGLKISKTDWHEGRDGVVDVTLFIPKIGLVIDTKTLCAKIQALPHIKHCTTFSKGLNLSIEI